MVRASLMHEELLCCPQLSSRGVTLWERSGEWEFNLGERRERGKEKGAGSSAAVTTAQGQRSSVVVRR